jgi:antitoxin ParD1/3/4
MSTITMNISMPSHLKAFVDERVSNRGYGSYSEYVRDLVRRDELDAAKEKLCGLITAGLASGPAVSADAGFWDQREQALMAQHSEGKAKPAAL